MLKEALPGGRAGTWRRTGQPSELVRYISDRLDLPVEYLMDQLKTTQSMPTAAPAQPEAAPAPRAATIVAAAEREFLTFCVASGTLGREYLARARPEHFSSESMRRARDHLERRFDDPLAGLPEDDPLLASDITGIVMRAQEETASETVLQMNYLNLEQRRVDRAVTRATRDEDFEALRALSEEKQEARRKLDDLMGSMA